MNAAPEPRLFDGQSREFRLLCALDSTLLWLDEAGRRVLQCDVGRTLRELAAAGTEDKIHRLFVQAKARELGGAPWEVVLQVGGDALVCALYASALPDGKVAITGSLVAHDYGAALGQLSENLSEMAALHRETDRQQRELLRRHEELLRLHTQLQESHRGVVALHAEIGEKDDNLRRAGEIKSRLVANVSHEFRTPLNSILGLTKLLLARTDGDLNEEQETQLTFIKQSAEALYALVNDMLDLSKTEAERVALRTQSFTANNFFIALRGMLRPLATNPAVELVFDLHGDLPVLDTDEGKLAQIMRNLVSNALKFTQRGEVRVTAHDNGDGSVSFEVRDSGIGIPHDEQERIFEEFYQVENPLQKEHKGTGLGLTLSRNLAARLGGTLTLESEPGRGSTFILTIPHHHPEARAVSALVERSHKLEPGHQPILVVEDDRQTLLLYEKYLRGSGFQVIPARSLDEAREALKRVMPAAVVLDIMLDGEASWSFLADLKANEATRNVPALVVTVTNREEKARALGADEFFMKPMEREWLLNKLHAMAGRQLVETLLVIDDDRVARYLVKKTLADSPYHVIEAADGIQGLELARTHSPDVIFLDFVMPEMSAFDVLDELKRDPATRNIPVVIYTSKNLAEGERKRLESEASAILSKQSLSREIAIARIREALEKAGIRGTRGGVAP
ncbi:MAG: histidine kinase [Myxococcaceae bacterium]|nr:histidine kinase [Myxococcaceae bacterium]